VKKPGEGSVRKYPGVRIRVTGPHGDLINVTSAELYYICKFAGYSFDGIFGWENWIEFIKSDQNVKLSIEPIMIEEPNDPEV